MTEIQTDDIMHEIASYRPVLFKLAMLQLRDKASAEDAAQDTMLAAIEGHERFEGRSTLRTWLVSILRFKVLDIFRSQARLRTVSDTGSSTEELDVSVFDGLFEESGCWAAPKDAWSDPQTHLEQVEFFKILEACLTNLPPATARIFLMREWLDLKPDEICSRAEVSSGNLRVILYRARMQLRTCLDVSWDRS